MLSRLIEGYIFTYASLKYSDGTLDWELTLFGWAVRCSKPDVEIYRKLSMLSLYTFSQIDTDYTIHHCPLLKRVLGEQLSAETPVDNKVAVDILGKRYVVTRYLRERTYARVSWLTFSTCRVYGVVCLGDVVDGELVIPNVGIEDTPLLPITFALPGWKYKAPSPQDVVKQAYVLNDLLDSIST